MTRWRRWLAGMLAFLAVAGCQARSRDDGAAADSAATPATSAPAAGAIDGVWVVVGHRLGGVSALSAADADAWNGRTARFADHVAAFCADTCRSPVYRVAHLPADSLLLEAYRSAPASLALPAGVTLARIEIACDGLPWSAPGATLLMAPDGALWAPWDGAFFRLERP